MNPFIINQFKKAKRIAGRVNSAYQRLVEDANIRRRFLRMPGFSNLLEKIFKGEIVGSDDLLPYLCQETKEDRLWVNFNLAEAFYIIGNYEQAKVFIHRVWEFSDFDEIYLPKFIEIHAAINDIDSIREAHKALGMKKSDENKIVQALNHFNDWQYSYATHRGLDDYQYDYDVLNRITQIAKPHSFPIKQPQLPKNRKTRLAYLMFGMLHSNSVIVKISLLLAKYHDSSQFEVVFYVPEQTSTILECQEAVGNIKIINELGWDVILAPDLVSEEESLVNLSRVIYESNPDILITNAALADFKHYFITSLQPAPLIIGLCQGPAPQFIAPNFDWSITWFKSLLIDCPTDCSWVNLRLDLPERTYSREESKSFFGIPEKNLVVMTCGRATKLQDIGFLKALVDSVSSQPNVNLVIVGLENLPSSLCDQMKPNIVERIKVIAWEKDFHKVLCMADVVVDTYPSGGGVVIKDAASLGAPIVSFKHNYMEAFSQMECSAAEEVIGIPELLIDRGDFAALNKVLSKLLTDQKYRKKLSELCKERTNETSGNPEKMVKNCEQVYFDVIQKKSNSAFGGFSKGRFT